MSQRENSTFSTPRPLPSLLVGVSADEDFAVGPRTISTVFLLLSVFPASLYSSVAGLPAIGVGHPVSITCRPSSPFVSTLAVEQSPSLLSRFVGVAQPAS